MTYNRKESEKEKKIPKSLCCIAETNEILYIKTSIRRNIPMIPLGFAFH